MAKKSADEAENASSRKGRLASFLKSDAVAKIHKNHGSSMLIRASDRKAQTWRRLPSGILPLDLSLGGGFPAGVVNTLWGDKGATKTSTIIKTMANAQKMCRDCYHFFPEYAVIPELACKCKGKQAERQMVCAYIDVEGTLDLQWCQLLGLNIEELLLSQPDFAEASLDILEGILREGVVDVIALDSLAFLTPKKEIEESTAKDLMGVQARTIGKGIRKLTAALNSVGLTYGHDRRPTVFFTNQVRMALNVMFGNPETAAGGKAPGFAAVTEIKMRPGKYEMDETTGFPLKAEMKFRVEKNKSSFNKMEGDYKLVLSSTATHKIGETYDEPWLLERGQIYGVVERKGMTWSALDKKFGKKEDLLEALCADKPFRARVWEAVKQVAAFPQAGLAPVDPAEDAQAEILEAAE